MKLSRFSKFLLMFLAMCIFVSVSCTKESGSDDVDVQNAPYGRWDANTATIFEGTVPDNPDAILKMEKAQGTETVVDGKTFNQYTGGFVAAKSDDLSTTGTGTGTVTASVDENGTIYITTLQSDGFLGTLTGIPGLDIWLGETITLSEPIEINVDDMETGETRDAVIELSAMGETMPVSVTYGPVEDDVTVMTTMGPVIGCRKYEVSGTFTFAGLPLSDSLIEGTGYIHPTLGLVGWEAPDLGIGMSMSGTSNYGDATEGFNVIEMTDILTATATHFNLHTYDRIGEFDADKDTHAKMLLEMRWADPDIAVSHDAPDPLMVTVTFGTMGGLYYFPHELIESPVSIFFPEENGNGFRYWYAFVDQAAKNQDENGVSYSITVDRDASLPDLRVTARIGYTILPGSEY